MSSWHPAEAIAAFAITVALGLASMLAVSAGVAGLVFGDGWASAPLANMPDVATRLPENLGDPRRAWPTEARGRLPSAPGFYVSAVLVCSAVALVGALGLTAFRRVRRAEGARWASAGQLRSLHVRRPTPGRLVLGRHRDRLIAAEPGQSALVIAPTQSAKTTALAVPAILEWNGPIIALSVKTDLVRDTVARRRRTGRVAVFDPTASTGLDVTSSWTPLLSCREWTGARRVASAPADGAAPSRQTLSDGDFWYSAAAKLLAPLLFAAANAGLTMDEVVAWIDTQDASTVLVILQGLDCMEALNAMQANWSRDERQRSSIYTTAATVLEAYADPGVLERSRVPEIRAEWFLDGGASTLYLCASAREQRRLRPVFVALLQEMLEAAYSKAGRHGAALDPPLLLVLDEVASIAPLPDLDVVVSTAPATASNCSRSCRTLLRPTTAGAASVRTRSSTTTGRSCSGLGWLTNARSSGSVACSGSARSHSARRRRVMLGNDRPRARASIGRSRLRTSSARRARERRCLCMGTCRRPGLRSGRGSLTRGCGHSRVTTASAAGDASS